MCCDGIRGLSPNTLRSPTPRARRSAARRCAPRHGRRAPPRSAGYSGMHGWRHPAEARGRRPPRRGGRRRSGSRRRFVSGRCPHPCSGINRGHLHWRGHQLNASRGRASPSSFKMRPLGLECWPAVPYDIPRRDTDRFSVSPSLPSCDVPPGTRPAKLQQMCLRTIDRSTPADRCQTWTQASCTRSGKEPSSTGRVPLTARLTVA